MIRTQFQNMGNFIPANNSSNPVVMIESPYSGNIDQNVRYLSLCMADAGVIHKEIPYASHISMTQHPRAKNYYVSDYDEKWNILTREEAIDASQFFRKRCDKTVFYTDLGWSNGMHAAKAYCITHFLPYEERKIDQKMLSEKVPMFSQNFITALLKNDDYQKFLE